MRATDPISEADLILNADGSIYHLQLHPEHLADIIFTVGDPERVPQVSRYFDRIETQISHREFCTHVGYLGAQRLMVISSGMGTDNVEILLTEIDALANIDLATRTVKPTHRALSIIRIGTSGALSADVPVDSHVINRYAFGLDTLMQFYPLNMSPDEQRWSQELRQHLALAYDPYVKAGSRRVLKAWPGMTEGNAVTCPGFYAPQGRHLRLPPEVKNLPAKLSAFRFDQHTITNFEMETAGYYALGSLLGHDVTSTNAILANRATNKFSNRPAASVDLLIRKVLERIDDGLD